MAGIADTLPQELLDHILDHLDDEWPDLAACSLVCRAWLPAARRRIFSTLTIAPFNFRALLDHLHGPSLAVLAYTHTLLVDEGLYDIIWVVPTAATAALFRTIFTHAQIKHIRVSHIFDAMIEGVASSGVGNAHVTHLVLDGIEENLPRSFELIAAFPSLQSLSLSGSMAHTLAHPGAEHVVPPQLSELTLVVGFFLTAVLQWLGTHRVPPVRRFCLPAAIGSPLLQRFLVDISPTLEQLYLESAVFSTLDLTASTHLHTLAIMLTPGHTRHPSSAHATPAFTAALARACAAPRLRTVVLDLVRLQPSLRERELRLPQILHELELRAVDATLAAAPGLQSVQVRLPLWSARATERADADTDVRAQLPRCAGCGVLSVVPPLPLGEFGV